MNETYAHSLAGPQPTITIDVDLRNPGQFFACCGLLELAHRVWGCDVLGWFESRKFHLHVPRLLQEEVNQKLMSVLCETTFTTIDEDDSASPIIVKFPDVSPYRVDWWLKTTNDASLRTWGNCTSYNLLSSLCKEGINAGNLIAGFSYTTKMTSRLSVDPRSSWTALDAGFSPNDQNFTVATYPMVEFFAGIGLQRNRPFISKKSWHYTVWQDPLPSPLMPASGRILPDNKTINYSFKLAHRGKMTSYFTYSTEG